MMRAEAQWLGRRLAAFSEAQLGTVLSVGSGTAGFRGNLQPWIEQQVFEPLRLRGVPVLHHELEPAHGIDVVGDLTDPAVLQNLTELGVRTILCLNVLEHLPDPSVLVAALLTSLPHGGTLVLTVPHRFPYHPDPIDTMFRPSPEDLRGLAGTAEVLEADTVRCESLLVHWLLKPGKVAALTKGFRSMLGRRNGDDAPVEGASLAARGSAGSMLRMALVSTSVTYAVIRRP